MGPGLLAVIWLAVFGGGLWLYKARTDDEGWQIYTSLLIMLVSGSLFLGVLLRGSQLLEWMDSSDPDSGTEYNSGGGN